MSGQRCIARWSMNAAQVWCADGAFHRVEDIRAPHTPAVVVFASYAEAHALLPECRIITVNTYGAEGRKARPEDDEPPTPSHFYVHPGSGRTCHVYTNQDARVVCVSAHPAQEEPDPSDEAAEHDDARLDDDRFAGLPLEDVAEQLGRGGVVLTSTDYASADPGHRDRHLLLTTAQRAVALTYIVERIHHADYGVWTLAASLYPPVGIDAYRVLLDVANDLGELGPGHDAGASRSLYALARQVLRHRRAVSKRAP